MDILATVEKERPYLLMDSNYLQSRNNQIRKKQNSTPSKKHNDSSQNSFSETLKVLEPQAEIEKFVPNDKVELDKEAEYSRRTLKLYTLFISNLCKQKQIPKALRLIQRLRDFHHLEPDLQLWTSFLVATDPQYSSFVIRIFEEKIKKIGVDQAAYCSIISCLLPKSWDKALHYIQEFRRLEYKPDVQTLTVWLRHASLQDNLDEAVSTMKELQKNWIYPNQELFEQAKEKKVLPAVLNHTFHLPNFSVHHFIIPYTLMIKLALKHGKEDLAAECFTEFRKLPIPVNRFAPIWLAFMRHYSQTENLYGLRVITRDYLNQRLPIDREISLYLEKLSNPTNKNKIQ